jgi:hypothetical protein
VFSSSAVVAVVEFVIAALAASAGASLGFAAMALFVTGAGEAASAHHSSR